MTDIILGGPPIPLYEIDDLLRYDDQIINEINSLIKKYESSQHNIKYLYEIIIKIVENDTIFYENNAGVIKDSQLALTSANTFYVSLLTSITLIIIIWVFCLTGLYNWIIALILTSVIIFFILIISFAYSSQCERIINEENSKLNHKTTLNNLKYTLNNLKYTIYDLSQEFLSLDESIINNSNIKKEDKEIKKGCGCGK